jgi:hypothetical protein
MRQSAEIVAAQGSNRIRGYPDGGISCGIGKNLKDRANGRFDSAHLHPPASLLPGRICDEEGSNFVSQTPLEQIVVGFTSESRAENFRRGIELGKTAILYLNGLGS